GLLIVEGGLWVIGIVLYLRAMHTRRFAGHLALWAFIVVFTALWLLIFNGAPPPSVHVLVTVDLILFPIVLRLGILARSFSTPDRALRADITSKPVEQTMTEGTKQILVTGASGKVGSHFIRRVLQSAEQDA